MQVNVGNRSFKKEWVHFGGKNNSVNGLRINFNIGSIRKEITVRRENIHFKSVMCVKCTYIKSNSTCSSVHTLSPISKQERSHTVNGPVSISNVRYIYILNSRAKLKTVLNINVYGENNVVAYL